MPKITQNGGRDIIALGRSPCNNGFQVLLEAQARSAGSSSALNADTPRVGTNTNPKNEKRKTRKTPSVDVTGAAPKASLAVCACPRQVIELHDGQVLIAQGGYLEKRASSPFGIRLCCLEQHGSSQRIVSLSASNTLSLGIATSSLFRRTGNVFHLLAGVPPCCGNTFHPEEILRL